MQNLYNCLSLKSYGAVRVVNLFKMFGGASVIYEKRQLSMEKETFAESCPSCGPSGWISQN